MKKINYVEGTTLNRYTKIGSRWIKRDASYEMRRLGCTHCAGPHDPLNTNCWATAKVGKKPEVLTIKKSLVWDPKTGKSHNATFEKTSFFERSKIHIGVLKFQGISQ